MPPTDESRVGGGGGGGGGGGAQWLAKLLVCNKMLH